MPKPQSPVSPIRRTEILFCLKIGFKGFGVPEAKLSARGKFLFEGNEYELRHGSVVIAAITSCTNTSNPSVMLGAGINLCTWL